MSVSAYKNATLGFVRRLKMRKGANRDEMLECLQESLIDSGYFEEASAITFVAALKMLAEYSDTRRKK